MTAALYEKASDLLALLILEIKSSALSHSSGRELRTLLQACSKVETHADTSVPEVLGKTAELEVYISGVSEIRELW